MQACPFRPRWIVCPLICIAALIGTTPLAAAPGTQDPGPTSFLVHVIPNGGPEFYATGFEGLGDIVATQHDNGRGKGRGATATATLRGRVRFVKGFTSDRYLWDWRQQVLTGQGGAARRDVIVAILDQVGAELARWELTDAWPENLTYSLANTTGPPLEELVINYGGITRSN